MPLVEDPDGGGHIRNTANIWRGRIAWLSAPVQKTGGPQGPVGSNPTPSANIPLAQLEKACDYESQDREFESLKGCHVAVVQLEERLIVAQKVADSNSASHPIFYIGVSHSGDCSGLQNRRFTAHVGSSPTAPAATISQYLLVVSLVLTEVVKNASIAQLVKHRFSNPKTVSSSLTGSSIFYKIDFYKKILYNIFIK